MSNCTHCNKEIIRCSISAVIPGNEEEKRYVCCSSCGNVMIGSFIENDLVSVIPTPTEDTPETHIMIEEARRLFKEADVYVGPTILSKEVPTPTFDDEDEYSFSDPCINCGDTSCSHNKNYDHKQDDSGFFKKLLHRIRHFFRR